MTLFGDKINWGTPMNPETGKGTKPGVQKIVDEELGKRGYE